MGDVKILSIFSTTYLFLIKFVNGPDAYIGIPPLTRLRLSRTLN